MSLRSGVARLGVLVFLLAVVLSGIAGAARADSDRPAVPASLLDQARSQPGKSFRVIAQGRQGWSSAQVASLVASLAGKRVDASRALDAIDGVATTVTGTELQRLATVSGGLLAIGPDLPIALSGKYGNAQEWPKAVHADALWSLDATPGPVPSIAIVDSGVDASSAELGGRLTSVDLTSSTPNAQGDGYGHGTFVASLAAGGSGDYAGAAPAAPIVSLDVVDDTGHAYTSDVIKAIDWIILHRTAYNIRVANFSLESAGTGTIRFDPLNAAVERLWLSGVVVVAAAGNGRVGDAPNGVVHAPGNDPFVITVGALDLGAGGADTPDDAAAPWSSYGYTTDGFLKPELSAPGRYIVAPVPGGSTLRARRPDAVVDDKHLKLSGTSFAAPVVAGTAAMLLATHPRWTPDQVKGALMQSAAHLPKALTHSVGVGELDARAALAMTDPPNPNGGLNRFVVPAADGSGLVFDAASWTDASWTDASWTDASWTDASWTDASWTDAAWASASWTDASWTDASWTDASWTDAAPVR